MLRRSRCCSHLSQRNKAIRPSDATLLFHHCPEPFGNKAQFARRSPCARSSVRTSAAPRIKRGGSSFSSRALRSAPSSSARAPPAVRPLTAGGGTSCSHAGYRLRVEEPPTRLSRCPTCRVHLLLFTYLFTRKMDELSGSGALFKQTCLLPRLAQFTL